MPGRIISAEGPALERPPPQPILREGIVKRSLITYMAIMLLVAAAMSQALAQYDEDKPSKLSVGIGLYRPSGAMLRTEGGSTWKAFSVNYNLKINEMGKPDTCIAIEHTAKSGTWFDGHLTAIRCVKLWQKKSASPRGAYFGTGAGIYLLKAEQRYVKEYSGAKFGISLLGGYNLNENWFAELRYNRVGELAPDVNFSGLALYVGAGRVF